MITAKANGKKIEVQTQKMLDECVSSGMTVYNDTELIASNKKVVADNIPTIPEDVTEVRDIYREAFCALLGIDADCTDDELLASATELGEKLRGKENG